MRTLENQWVQQEIKHSRDGGVTGNRPASKGFAGLAVPNWSEEKSVLPVAIGRDETIGGRRRSMLAGEAGRSESSHFRERRMRGRDRREAGTGRGGVDESDSWAGSRGSREGR